MIRGRIWVLLALLAAVGLTGSLFELNKDRNSASASSQQVLGTNTYRQFSEQPGMPSPNAIFDQVNSARIKSGLQPLARNDILATLAQQRAEDMSVHTLYSHKGSDGLFFDQLLASSGYAITYGCENLDIEFVTDPAVYVNSWMQSTAGHKECLLNPVATEAGYAVATLGMKSGTDMPSYVVVAIHATSPKSN